MSKTDPIADFLTRIRNAAKAKHQHVDIPASNMKRKLAALMLDQNYIANYTNIDDAKQGLIRVYLKYQKNGDPVIKELKRVSRPGLRKYVNHNDLPRVYNNLGVAVMSTSSGLMTAREATRQNIGGEVVCYIY